MTSKITRFRIALIAIALLAALLVVSPAANADTTDDKPDQVSNLARTSGQLDSGTPGGEPPPPPVADLAVTSVLDGENCTLTVTVTNVSTLVATDAPTIVEIDGNSFPVPVLNPAGFEPYTVTGPFVSGTVSIVANPGIVIPESAFGNNTENIVVPATCVQLPDLEITGVSVDGCTVTITVVNNGPVDSPLADGGIFMIGAGGVVIVDWSAPSVAANTTTTVDVVFPPGTNDETMTFYINAAAANVPNVFDESFADNNSFEPSEAITVCETTTDPVFNLAVNVTGFSDCALQIWVQNIGDIDPASAVDITYGLDGVETGSATILASSLTVGFSVPYLSLPFSGGGMAYVSIDDPYNLLGDVDLSDNTVAGIEVPPACDTVVDEPGEFDLEVQNLEFDEETCSVSFAVINNGTADYDGDVAVVWHQGTGGNQVLSAQNYLLEPGDFFLVTVPGPFTTAGNIGVDVLTQSESNTNNNDGDITVPDACLLDLVLVSVELSDTCHLEITVENDGEIDLTQDVDITYVLDGTPTVLTVSASDLTVGAALTIVNQQPLVGTDLSVIIDESGLLDEFNITNNFLGDIDLIAAGCDPQPNLVVTNVWNDFCGVSYSVQNTGDATSTPTTAELTDQNGNSWTANIPALAPTDTWTLPLPVNFLSAGSASVDLAVTVDADSFDFTLPANCEPQLDLAITNLVMSPIDCTLTFDLANVGDLDLTTAVDLYWGWNSYEIESFDATATPLAINSSTSITGVGPYFGVGSVSVSVASSSLGDLNDGNNSQTVTVPAECLGFDGDLEVNVSSSVPCVYDIVVTNIGTEDIADDFVVTVGFDDYAVAGLPENDSWTQQVGPTFTGFTVDIAADSTAPFVAETNENNNTSTINVPASCLPDLTPQCSSMYVSVMDDESGGLLTPPDHVYLLDEDGYVEFDFGTFGFDSIDDIGFFGTGLYAVADDGVDRGLYSLDLATGTSTLLTPIAGSFAGLAGDANVLIASMTPTMGLEYDMTTWINPISLPTINPSQMIHDIAVDPLTGDRHYSIRHNNVTTLAKLSSGTWTTTPSLDFRGLMDRGGALFGVTAYGEIWDLENNVQTSTAPARSIGRVTGAASYWEASCNPWQESEGDDELPTCSAMFASAKLANGTHHVYLLDEDGYAEQDFGTFGFDKIHDIGFYGDQLYALATVGTVRSLYALDLGAGTSTVALTPVSGYHTALDGDITTLVMSTGPASADDYDLTSWVDPVTLPTLGTQQWVPDLAVNPINGDRTYIVHHSLTSSRLVTIDSADKQTIAANNNHDFRGLMDRGGALFGMTEDGHIYDVATNTRVSTAPSNTLGATITGAAAYWESSTCAPWITAVSHPRPATSPTTAPAPDPKQDAKSDNADDIKRKPETDEVAEPRRGSRQTVVRPGK